MRLVHRFDAWFIHHLRRLEITIARAAIFIVYFWFGFLKIIGASPATPLVQTLFARTIGFMPFSTFYVLFSGFEVLIGVLFLIRGMERVAIFLLGLHLITTIMPLVFLPSITWQGFLIPTLEGQYIIKNVLIAALAVVIGAQVAPFKKS